MTITLSSFTDAQLNGTPVSVTPTLSTGQTVVVCLRWYHATATVSSVTIADNSSPTVRGSTASGGPSDARLAWYVLDNVTSAGAKLVEFTCTTGCPSGVSVWVLDGAKTDGAFDAANTATGTTTNPSLSLTTTAANSAIFAALATNGGDPTAGTGYTISTFANANWWEEGEYQLDMGSAAAKTVDFTHSGTSDWTMNAIAIKQAGATQSNAPRAMHHIQQLRG